jgi:hypothetical protein
LLVVALRGPSAAAGGTPDDGKTEKGEPAPRAKNAPADRVTAAVALGPEALEALAAEFPEDSAVKKQLALAYHAQGRSSDAMRAITILLEADKEASKDEEIVQAVVTTTTLKGTDTADDEAFAILEGRLGERGVDALVDLAAKGATRELRARAAKSLAKPEVRANASPAASVLLDFRGAESCSAKKDLLARAKDHGDGRLLPTLKPLASTRGCRRFLARVDCWPCLRKDAALEDAISAIEARNAKN